MLGLSDQDNYDQLLLYIPIIIAIGFLIYQAIITEKNRRKNEKRFDEIEKRLENISGEISNKDGAKLQKNDHFGRISSIPSARGINLTSNKGEASRNSRMGYNDEEIVRKYNEWKSSKDENGEFEKMTEFKIMLANESDKTRDSGIEGVFKKDSNGDFNAICKNPEQCLYFIFPGLTKAITKSFYRHRGLSDLYEILNYKQLSDSPVVNYNIMKTTIIEVVDEKIKVWQKGKIEIIS